MAERLISLSPMLRITLLGILPLITAASQCYFPDGNLAAHDNACYTDGRVSHCCSPNSVCLSNGLCLAVELPYTLSRGSCTDQSWGSGCPSICETIEPSTGALISHFNGTGTGATFCCSPLASSDNSVTCSPVNGQSQYPFTLAQGTLIPGVAALANSQTTMSMSMRMNSSHESTAMCSSMTNLKLNTVGVGVGVPLGVTTIAALLWGLYERRRRKWEAVAAAAPSVPVFSDSRTGSGMRMGSYPQRFLKRVKSAYGEERSY